MLVLSISEDFDKLFQDGSVTTMTPLCELGRIMVMTVYFAFMFVVTVLRSEYCRADRAGKMFDMVFAIQGRDIGTPEGTTALVA